MRFTALMSLGLYLLTVLCVPATAASVGGQAQYPFRLRLRVERSTLTRGENAQITVEFLDRNYNRLTNDRRRVIWFELLSGSGYSGSGRISPSQITAEPGDWSRSGAVFYPERSGKTIVRANSDGLESDQSYLYITEGRASLLSRLLSPTVFADSNIYFDIDPKTWQVPANNTSRAPFTVTLAGDTGPVIVKTEPACKMTYKDKEGLGALLIGGASDHPLSDERVYISTSRTGLVVVTAEVLSTGTRAEAKLDAVLPRPAKILFDPPQDEEIRTDENALLTVKLVDEDNIDLKFLDHEWQIRLACSTNRESASFDDAAGQKLLRLSNGQTAAQVAFKLTDAPSSREIHVRAQDISHGKLQPATKKMLFKGEIPLPMYVLLLAGLGGIVGGLVRDLYKLRTNLILPKWINGRLELGVTGNAPFSFALGLLLFAAGRVGVIQPLDQLLHSENSMVEIETVALFLGVVGGFGRTIVLDRLLNRLLPDKAISQREAGVSTSPV